MSEIIPATCEASIVTADSKPVPTAEILSHGIGESEGILVMRGDKQYYLTSNADDIKTVIEKLISTIQNLNDALNKIGTTLTSIGAGMTGATTAPPPTLAADVAVITSKVTALGAVSTQLDTLKESLK